MRTVSAFHRMVKTVSTKPKTTSCYLRRFGNRLSTVTAFGTTVLSPIASSPNGFLTFAFSAPWNTFTLEPDDWNTGLGAGKWRFWEGSADVGR